MVNTNEQINLNFRPSELTEEDVSVLNDLFDEIYNEEIAEAGMSREEKVPFSFFNRILTLWDKNYGRENYSQDVFIEKWRHLLGQIKIKLGERGYKKYAESVDNYLNNRDYKHLFSDLLLRNEEARRIDTTRPHYERPIRNGGKRPSYGPSAGLPTGDLDEADDSDSQKL